MNFAYGYPVTRERFTTSEKGDRTLVSSLVIDGCVVTPAKNDSLGNNAREFNDRASTVVTRAVMYGPYHADITPLDVIVANGTRWEVDGSVNRWYNGFTGWESGVEVTLIRKDG